jgi:hypothetical protein
MSVITKWTLDQIFSCSHLLEIEKNLTQGIES